MDTASSIIGLFNTCLHVYRKIASTVDVESNAIAWHTLMRIERTRFEVWGRTLNFLDAKSGAKKTPGIHEVLDLGGILQVEAAYGLVEDILKSVARTLSDFDNAAQKYQLTPTSLTTDAALARKRDRVRAAWLNAKGFTKHFILVVKDEEMIKDLLQSLTSLNDGLEKLLSVSQRAQAARALAAGVLVDFEDPQELAAVWKFSGSKTARPRSILATTAQVKQMCVQEKLDSKPEEGQSKNAVELGQGESFVPKYELDLSRVNISQHPESTGEKPFWPIGLVELIQDSINNRATPAIIEWREPHPISPGTIVDWDALERRRDLVVELLQMASGVNDGGIYPVLHCAGYVKHQGRLNGKSVDLIGFVSMVPDWADGSKEPTTLYQLLSEAFDSDEIGLIPSLRTRYSLARSLSYGIYQLHCSKWVHRTLTSQNIIFFRDKVTGVLNIGTPYVTGLQYSRPDDQPHDSTNRERQPFSEKMDTFTWGPLAMYIHPDFSQDRLRHRRYRRSDDIYSLGVLLSEIALWEPAKVFLQETGSVSLAAQRMLKVMETELAAEVGETYRDATLACLKGLRDQPPSTKGDGRYSQESVTEPDVEIGLEEDLLWMVVREIEKCSV